MTAALETLCQRCGMCCDSTLFARVPVSAEERDRLLQKHGVQATQRPDGSLALPQRCAALEGCSCRAYSDRPARCREYHCNLYAAVAEGEVGSDEATQVVNGAHERINALGRAHFGRTDQPGIVSRYRAAEMNPLGPELSAEARAAFAELQSYLDRHFRGRR